MQCMKYEEDGYKSASSINKKNVIKNFQCLGLRQTSKLEGFVDIVQQGRREIIN